MISPRFVITGVVLALVFGLAYHYRSVIAQRAELITQNVQLSLQVSTLEVALADERAAVEVVTRQRQAAREALEDLRRGRAGDPEAQEWGAQPIPPGEQARLCAAMPWLEGCSP
jgi:hypothetical protein